MQSTLGEVYAERLSGELDVKYEFATARIKYYETVGEANAATYSGLTQQVDMNDEAILINAFRASQYVWYERRRATYDEIISSGSQALIKDMELRDAAVIFYIMPIFEDIESEGQNSQYRKIFRETIEPAIHDELQRNCGDIADDNNRSPLDYPCKIDASDENMRVAVAALRDAPGIFKALKLRNAEISARLKGLKSNLEPLIAFKERERTP